MIETSTDAAWEQWGVRDPYYGVLTHPKFRRAALTQHGKREFFESGDAHVAHVVDMVRQYIDAQFHPGSILDFGCGVGRTLISFAKLAPDTVGVDISPSMLAEARRNCDEQGVPGVRLALSDPYLSSSTDTFEFIHSFIVFQHIPPERGRELVRRLLRRLAPGGVAALQFCYSKQHYAATHGLAPVSAAPAVCARCARRAPPAPPARAVPSADPEMQMNPYNLNELMFLIQSHGARKLHAEFTDHGGELGLFVLFQITAAVI